MISEAVQSLRDKLNAYAQAVSDRSVFPVTRRPAYDLIARGLNAKTFVRTRKVPVEAARDIEERTFDARGYLFDPPVGPGRTDAVIRASMETLAGVDLDGLTHRTKGKGQYLKAFDLDEQLGSKPEFLDYLLDPLLLGCVARYLREPAILQAVALLYSPNEKIYEGSSQHFHLDPEGVRQVKLFMCVEEAALEGGPFTYFPADLSSRYYAQYRGGRLEDEELFRVLPRTELVRFVGPAGSALLIDTSRCFHFGSRPGSKKRLLLCAQYVSPFSQCFPLVGKRRGKFAHLVRPGMDPLQRYALTAA